MEFTGERLITVDTKMVEYRSLQTGAQIEDIKSRGATLTMPIISVRCLQDKGWVFESSQGLKR